MDLQDMIIAALADKDNYFEDGVLYGPGDGDRVVLATFSKELLDRYAGPLPAWVARRGYRLWDVVGNQYEPTLPAMVVTAEGFRPVDDPGAVYTWAEIEDDYKDREAFFIGLVKFTL